MPHKRKRGGSTMRRAPALPMSSSRAYGGARRKRGGAWYNDLWDVVKKVAAPVNKILKDTGIISKGARAVGWNNVGDQAEKWGYGKHRRHIGGAGASRRGGSLAVKF